MSSKVLLIDDYFAERKPSNKVVKAFKQYIKPLLAITLVTLITYLYQQNYVFGNENFINSLDIDLPKWIYLVFHVTQ